ncbi:MAG: hypothetical protein LAO21_23005 [Acidobacteriia bacterium]|nr:hypothetical protein [Terriglobia bacterium]
MSFWERLGFVRKEKGATQTPEEMGTLLFACACKSMSEDLEKPDLQLLKSIRSTTNPNTFDAELQVTIMYAAMNAVMTSANSEDKTYRVLDSMNGAFINFVTNAVKTSGKQVFWRYLTSRYAEYTAARQEKRGPNELWPLSEHILKNLLGKETMDDEAKDPYTMMVLSVYYVSQLLFFNDLLKRIQIKG